MTNGEWSENLEEAYEHVYTRDKCDSKYGSDKKELKEHICPNCEKK